MEAILFLGCSILFSSTSDTDQSQSVIVSDLFLTKIRQIEFLIHDANCPPPSLKTIQRSVELDKNTLSATSAALC